MRATYIVIVLLCVLAGGCASQGIGTASGRPEVVVRGVTREKLAGAITGAFVNNGWTVRSGDGVNLVYEKQGDGVTSFFFGTDWDPRAFARATVTIFAQEAGEIRGQRAVLQLAIISNRGTAFERDQPVTDTQTYERYQKALEDIRDGLEREQWAAPAGAGAKPIPAWNPLQKPPPVAIPGGYQPLN